ncbi:acyl-CoA thioesterase [Eubacteriales bacterium OttesenSCG-928-N14]|nr:acyl-CoA thioesterase [Eubacteriales bacterium OttesenSCG-928-N14]
MEQRPAKRVSDSLTEQMQILMPQASNGENRLFGGQLMQWIDIVAAVTARRHCNCNVTTAVVDSLQFIAPVHMNSTVVLVGRITYVGNTSMEVRVDTYVETLSGERNVVNTAYFVMVALDQEDCPVTVPSLILETEEEKAEWDAGEKRNALRKKRREEKY